MLEMKDWSELLRALFLPEEYAYDWPYAEKRIERLESALGLLLPAFQMLIEKASTHLGKEALGPDLEKFASADLSGLSEAHDLIDALIKQGESGVAARVLRRRRV